MPSSVISDQLLCFPDPFTPANGFSWEQTFHSVPACHPFQSLHHDLIMVYRNIRFCIDRSKLMLSRRSLVMLSFRRNAYLPKFFVYIFHKRCDSLSDRSEIVIVHLLTFRTSSRQTASFLYRSGLFSEETFLNLQGNIPVPHRQTASLSLKLYFRISKADALPAYRALPSNEEAVFSDQAPLRYKNKMQ